MLGASLPPSFPLCEPMAVGSLLSACAGGNGGFFGSSITLSLLNLDHMSLISWPSAMFLAHRSYHILQWSMWLFSTGESMAQSSSVGWNTWNSWDRLMPTEGGWRPGFAVFLGRCHSPSGPSVLTASSTISLSRALRCSLVKVCSRHLDLATFLFFFLFVAFHDKPFQL